MISADFYPTTYTDSQNGVQTTGRIDILSNTTGYISNAYWLGWISVDNLPQMMHLSILSVTQDGDGYRYKAIDVTPQANFPCTYINNDRDYANNFSYTVSPFSGTYGRRPDSNSYFIPQWYNSLNPQATANGFTLPQIGVFDTYGASEDAKYNGNDRYFVDFSSNSVTDFVSWLNGEYEWNITINNTPIPIVAADLETNGFITYDYFDGTNYHTVNLAIVNGSFPPNEERYNSSSSSRRGTGKSSFAVKMTVNDNDILVSSNSYRSFDSRPQMYLSGHEFFPPSSTNPYSNILENGLYTGGFVFDISPEESADMMRGRTYYSHVNGNTLFFMPSGYSDYVYNMFRIYKPSEISKLMGLQIRVRDNSQFPTGVYGWVENVYAPYITDDEEFTATFITGNLSDSEYRDKLRPWQYTNITANYVTEDDIPEYEPPTPEPGDDQGSNTGSVLRPTTLGVGGTNGFITQYSLTAAQIAEIGRLLWYKFSDASAVEQYVKNYMFFTVSTTGTLNLSNLLDYFVSLRVYPFPLINVPSHAAAGQDMWIGAGIVPLTFSTNLHTINNYADYIDAGSCTIPRYYNDFRDFAHTQIMLYLPYCGTVQLNPADVVGSTLHAQYAVDFATGGVTAYVDCTTWDGSQFVIAVLTGSIGADIPLTASNAAQIAARIAGDALNFAGTVGEAVSADVGRSAQAIGSAATGDVVGAAIGVANTYAGRIGGALDVAQTGLQIATAEGVKMPMLSGGRGFGSFGAPQTAYVQIRRGIYAEGQQPTQGFKEAYGEAYSKPVQVSSCTGFTVFANVDTSGLQCDAMEREQVKKMMQAGIYI